MSHYQKSYVCQESYIEYMDSCLKYCLENNMKGFETHNRWYIIGRNENSEKCPSLQVLHKQHFDEYKTYKKWSFIPVKLTDKIHYIKVEKI